MHAPVLGKGQVEKSESHFSEGGRLDEGGRLAFSCLCVRQEARLKKEGRKIFPREGGDAEGGGRRSGGEGEGGKWSKTNGIVGKTTNDAHLSTTPIISYNQVFCITFKQNLLTSGPIRAGGHA